MSNKVNSVGRTLEFRGFLSDARKLDHKRIKYSELKAPEGVELTDEMIDTALEDVQRRDPDIQSLRRNQDREIILTPKGAHSARKAMKLLERLRYEAFRLIVNAIIDVIRKAKRKLRRAGAQNKEKATGFLNDKSRTIPVPSPAS